MNKRGFISALSLGSGTLFSLPAKDRFGASAPGDVVMREYGFTAGRTYVRGPWRCWGDSPSHMKK